MSFVTTFVLGHFTVFSAHTGGRTNTPIYQVASGIGEKTNFITLNDLNSEPARKKIYQLEGFRLV